MKKVLLPAFLFLFFCSAMAVYRVKAEDHAAPGPGKGLFKELQLFADAITIINTDYVKKVNVKTLIYGAIRGMMSTLDGYSQFMSPEDFRDFAEETKGEFVGIGIEIGMQDGIPTVIAPIEGTPAYVSGIRNGDMIVKIDGRTTQDMSIDDVVKMFRGQIGSKVKVTVFRKRTGKIITFDIKRGNIELQSVKYSRIIDGNIGYIRIVEFRKRAAKDLKKTVTSLLKKGATSLIIDIRNNPGGLLESAIDTAELFLDKGQLIVYMEGRNKGDRTEFRARTNSEFNGIPLVVLVNKGSASASEIFASSIKDNKRGVIVGTTTFGKGSVQVIIPLEDRSALRLTTAAYFSPLGNIIMDKGVTPDVIVKKMIPASASGMSAREEKKETLYRKAEGAGQRNKPGEQAVYDNQLKAAVNMLNGVRVFDSIRSKEPDPAGQDKEG